MVSVQLMFFCITVFDFYGVFFNDSSMDCMAYCIGPLKTSFQCGAVDIKRFF